MYVEEDGQRFPTGVLRVCPVLQHEQKIEKMQLMDSRVSEEVCVNLIIFFFKSTICILTSTI